MGISIYFEEAAQVSVAFIIGVIIGLEREFCCIKTVKENADAVYIYRISPPDRNYDAVIHFLLQHKEVKSFEV